MQRKNKSNIWNTGTEPLDSNEIWQKEKKMEKEKTINAWAVKNSDCMDVDLEFYTNTMDSWGIQRKKKTNQAKTATREEKNEL